MSSTPALDLMSDHEPEAASNPIETPASVRAIADALHRAAIPFTPRQLPGPAPSVDALAAYLGCETNHIVQPVLMRGKGTKKPFLVLQSAATRVNDRLLAQMVGENLQRTDADFTQRFTGFPSQHTPPVGLLNRVPVLMDINLTRYARVWCPSGTPDVIFSLPTLVLARAISARIVQLH